MSDKKEQKAPGGDAKDGALTDPQAAQPLRGKVTGGEAPDNLRRRADWFQRRSGGRKTS